jgi:hypothetical protein
MLRSGLSGLLVWLVYGVLEFAGVLASHHSLLLLSWQWKLLALLLTAYALLGFLLGAAVGAILGFKLRGTGREDSRKQDQISAALTLVLAFLLNLLHGWPLPRREYIALLVAGLLAAAFIAAINSRLWQERAAFLANPWFLTVLLLGSPWVSGEQLGQSSEWTRTAASLLLVGAILITAAWWYRRSEGVGTQRRQWRTLAVVMGAGFVALLAPQWFNLYTAHAGTSPAQGRPNVVLISMDTVRADHLALYGYARDTTPHLREFAREATLYRRAMAVADMTLSAHASIFTGVYPQWHGAYLQPPVYPFGRPLSGERPTLAQLLQDNGYQTAAMMANVAYFNSSMGLGRGFHNFDAPRPALLADSGRPFCLSFAVRRMLNWAIDANDF